MLRLLFSCSLIIVLLRTAPITRAQSGIKDLHINYALDQAILCTREEAKWFYGTLDGLFQQVDNSARVTDSDSLLLWLRAFDQWDKENWGSSHGDTCFGVAYLEPALMTAAMFNVLEQLTGDIGEIPAQLTFQSVQEMAIFDQLALDQPEVPISVLRINLALRDLPHCSGEQAMAFYDTIDGYQNQMDKLSLVDDRISLRVRFQLFQIWRRKAWASFYERPCGSILSLINLLEFTAYRAALFKLTVSQPAGELQGLVRFVRNIAVEDTAAIEAHARE